MTTPTKTPTKTPAKAPAKTPAKAPAKSTGKRVVHANVSDATFDTWQNFAINNGVSVSGIVEALGSVGPLAGTGSINADALVKAARQVDADRRRRGSRNKG